MNVTGHLLYHSMYFKKMCSVSAVPKNVTALTMDCPFADVILGESAFINYAEEEEDKNTDGVEELSSNIDSISKVSDRPITGKAVQERQDKMQYHGKESVSTVETRNRKARREAEEVRNERVESEFLQDRRNRSDRIKSPTGELLLQNGSTEFSCNLKHEQQTDPTLCKVRALAAFRVKIR